MRSRTTRKRARFSLPPPAARPPGKQGVGCSLPGIRFPSASTTARLHLKPLKLHELTRDRQSRARPLREYSTLPRAAKAPPSRPFRACLSRAKGKPLRLNGMRRGARFRRARVSGRLSRQFNAICVRLLGLARAQARIRRASRIALLCQCDGAAPFRASMMAGAAATMPSSSTSETR